MGRNSLSMGANCRGKGGFTPFKNAQESVPRCALAFAISLQSLEIVRRWWLKPSQRHTPQRSTSTTKEANGLNILRLKAVAPRETLCYMRHDFAASRSCEA
jgi:hypothetical protein